MRAVRKMAASCSVCHAELPLDPKVRKRQRPRRCKRCNARAALNRRKSDPVLLLQHRWSNNARKHWPDAPASLCSIETVGYVWDRWGRQSVLSGIADHMLLCVSPAIKSSDPPTRDQLILLTSREAQSLSRTSKEERMAQLPEHVRAQINNSGT